MALIRTSVAVGDISGSVGGGTFARSKGGLGLRTRRKPINPRSERQQARRSNIAYLTSYWGSTLSAVNRELWMTYAANTSWTNRLGESIKLTGMNMFVAINSLLLLAGQSLKAAAPATAGGSAAPIFTVTCDVSDAQVKIAEPSVGFTKATTGDLLLIFMGRPQSPGQSGPPKGFRYAGTIVGSSSTPPTFPTTTAAPFSFTATQRVVVECLHIDVDGRPSFRSQAIATVQA
jgi:hypothetical protein